MDARKRNSQMLFLSIHHFVTDITIFFHIIGRQHIFTWRYPVKIIKAEGLNV